MAGIYLHIPFCKQACHYCDFHFSTSLRNKPEMVEALCKELIQRKIYLPGNPEITTIYFGGGTPSLLSETELATIFECLYQNYPIAEKAEITLEANPDDLSKEKLRELRKSPVNRLSIGIQSFYEEDLKWMNRAHTAKEAEVVLHNALEAGFKDLTADLIFGYPLLTDQKWETNIHQMVETGIRHISAYAMTVEKGTPLDRFIRNGKQPPMDEAQSARQFLFLMDYLSGLGWEQYEISNYAKDGCYSRHNTSYWQGIPYLGIGPSAHSFDGKSRQWNCRINGRYISDMNEQKVDFKKEELTTENRIDEFIMTRLRTMWGIAQSSFEERFGPKRLEELRLKMKPFIKSDQVIDVDGAYRLTRDGKLFADYIASELFC